ncbi:class I SAM-dependent methyltransferase [Leptospira sp. GIMC2001]|uniref:class I SAM-dependent methyltransferase n=1 Tax=Leptospira sp. GIMC2001 TaxID=1513297 RepID=UPI00234AAA34|nr:class I SAM-dependent methyltransferase [Leptospira sp. GIMC2001]WCL51217.1 class I SAM-dependent methyltransferase [Leptospira sp. GIMC2001]
MDYVFKKDETGIQFIGNFNQLYLDDEDPWNQSESESDQEMSLYYKNARRTLVDTLKVVIDQYGIKKAEVAEFGCGLGYVTSQLKAQLPELNFTGLDISAEAIRKAKILNGSNIQFIESNLSIYDEKLKEKFNIILVVNMLWYILEDLDKVLDNVLKYFNPSGNNIFILQNAFFKTEQMYGKDIINGFKGAEEYFKNALSKNVEIDFYHSSFKEGKSWTHHDGILAFGIK